VAETVTSSVYYKSINNTGVHCDGGFADSQTDDPQGKCKVTEYNRLLAITQVKHGKRQRGKYHRLKPHEKSTYAANQNASLQSSSN